MIGHAGLKFQVSGLRSPVLGLWLLMAPAFNLNPQLQLAAGHRLRYKIAWDDAYPLFKLRLESYL